MHAPVHATQMNQAAATRAELLKDVILLSAVILAGSIIFGLLFNRETSLSYSIGYNLYGAQRVLAGEIPYKDFHTLYPPATVYVNAAIFDLCGISLYNALFGVLIFKLLTTATIYGAARMLMGRVWALFAAAGSLLWLRPNGPFKAVPMHYGALFLAVALLLMLGFMRSGRKVFLIAAGFALGSLALFKHNIGAYALAGTILVILFERKTEPGTDRGLSASSRNVSMLLIGFLTPVLPVLFYIASQGALREMTRTLVLGPGDFLLSRLAGWPSPVAFILFISGLAGAALLVERLISSARLRAVASIALVAACCAVVILSSQSIIDSLIFYAPVGVILAGLAFVVHEIRQREARAQEAMLVVVIAGSAFLEAFPRFAREQAVASMPFVTLLLLYLLNRARPYIEHLAGASQTPWRSVTEAALVAVLPLTIFLVGARLFHSTYFDRGLSLKSNTELTTERGRGVLFPQEKAKEIDDAVAYIRNRVEEGGYFFAHAYAGSSYLFLADRNNPSGAQFWGGVGVTDAERAETFKALEEKRVTLIVTTERDLKAESYEPLREYMEKKFRPSVRFGEVIMFERVE